MAGTTDYPVYEYTTFPRQFISYRWFKPLLVLLLGVVFMFIFQFVLLIVASIWSGDMNFVFSIGDSYETMDVFSGPGALVELGGVACMLPALALAALVVGDRPYSPYSSSRGGWNWAAFGKCVVLAAVITGVATLIEYLFGAYVDAPLAIRFTTVGFVVCMMLAPFQCLAEEYFFRGFIMQTVGSWTKVPAIAIAVQAAFFAIMHPYNIVGIILIFVNGVVWGIVAWQTKGLEATGAIHIVNNMLAFGMAGFGLEAITSEVDMIGFAVAAAIDVVYALAVILLGKKFGWFKAKGDGTVKFNDKKHAKLARKQQVNPQFPNNPVPPQPYMQPMPQQAQQPYMQPYAQQVPQPYMQSVAQQAPQPYAQAATVQAATQQPAQPHMQPAAQYLAQKAAYPYTQQVPQLSERPNRA